MKEKSLEIYTDCACNKKNYGIGILMIDSDEYEFNFQFRTTKKLMNIEFDFESDSTSLIGESYAVLKSLQNLPGKYSKIILYTDNETVYKVLNKSCKERKKHIIFNKIIEKCRELMTSLNIEVRHIKGHCGVYGNEVVDKLSKMSLKDKEIPCCNNFTDKNLSSNIFEFNFFNSFKLDHLYFQI